VCCRYVVVDGEATIFAEKRSVRRRWGHYIAAMQAGIVVQ